MLPKLDSTLFTWQAWRAYGFNIPCRYETLTSGLGKATLRKHAVGWCYGENLLCRPKANHIAVMFEKDEVQFWFHLRNEEFIKIFQQKE